MPRFLNTFVLGTALTIPIAMAPFALQGQDQKNEHRDKDHDEHQWNSHEDKAYRMYEKENHRKHRDFAKINAGEQQSYWAWRHDHSDAQLKIEIR